MRSSKHLVSCIDWRFSFTTVRSSLWKYLKYLFMFWNVNERQLNNAQLTKKICVISTTLLHVTSQSSHTFNYTEQASMLKVFTILSKKEKKTATYIWHERIAIYKVNFNKNTSSTCSSHNCHVSPAILG